MLLDSERLAALEDEFNEHPKGIELPNFIWLMECAIHYPPEEKVDLVCGLVKLFNDIDINGDKHMEWSEFTQYIIDSVLEDNNAQQTSNNDAKHELTEADILDQAYARRSKRYQISNVIDTSLHPNLIKRIQYINSGKLQVLEQSSSKVKIYHQNLETKSSFESIQKSKLEEKGYILDQAYSEEYNQVGIVTSDRKMLFFDSIKLEKKCLWIHDQKRLANGIWYMPKNKIWVTSTNTHNFIQWKVDPMEKEFVKELQIFQGHEQMITDACEIILSGFIATSSLDGKIKLWDVEEQQLITELEDGCVKKGRSIKGVRGMSYTQDYGGSLQSIGYVSYINVWSPDSSLSKAYVGRLEGHSGIVVSCKIIPSSPNCLSVDDKHHIRIWDLRTFMTIQMIRDDISIQNSAVTCLEVIPHMDRFVVGGKRIQMYNNDFMRKNLETFNEELYALHVEFNSYYKTFSVLTKIDLRIYDAFTGKLIKVFNDLFDDRVQGELTCFVMGDRLRKFYIADNVGLIRKYNSNNGEIIQKIVSLNQLKEMQAAVNNVPQGFGGFSSQQNTNVNKRDNFEVSRQIYLTEEKLLVSGSCDSVVRIYEADEEQDIQLLRELKDGHRDSEITALEYSSEYLILASGSQNGIVTIWDFEVNKPEAIFQETEQEILCFAFCYPFPVLLAGSIDSSLCGYQLRLKKGKSCCLFKIMVTENFDRFRPSAVNSLLFMTSNKVEVKLSTQSKTHISNNLFYNDKDMQEKYDNPHEAYLIKQLGGYNAEKQINCFDSRKFFEFKKQYKVVQEAWETDNGISGDCHNVPENDKDKGKDTKGNDAGVGIKSSNLGTSQNQNKPLASDSKTNATIKDNFMKPDKKEPANDNNGEIFRSYLILGDGKGMIRYLTFDEYFAAIEIEKVDTLEYNLNRCNKFWMNLRRKDNLTISKNQFTMAAEQKKHHSYKTPHYFLIDMLEITNIKAHRAACSKLIRINEMQGYVSCSQDKTVQLWAISGQQWGRFNLVNFKRTTWDFPYDWVNAKMQELNDVYNLMEQLEERTINKAARDQQSNTYLYKNYILEMYKKDKDKVVSYNDPDEKYYGKKMELVATIMDKLGKMDKNMWAGCRVTRMRPMLKLPYDDDNWVKGLPPPHNKVPKEKTIDELENDYNQNVKKLVKFESNVEGRKEVFFFEKNKNRKLELRL